MSCGATREALMLASRGIRTDELADWAARLETELARVTPQVRGSEHPCATEAVKQLTTAVAALTDAIGYFEKAVATCHDYSAVL